MEGPEKIEENILELLSQFDLTDVKSIGLAIPGPVDGERNVITQATNIPGCEGYPFADNMQKV
ncbi:MAG: ROK family protein, partial [Erysipelotrichaceae bacterium]|nr:ROK family protein [Erysipelotrichaceae bacterium]